MSRPPDMGENGGRLIGAPTADNGAIRIVGADALIGPLYLGSPLWGELSAPLAVLTERGKTQPRAKTQQCAHSPGEILWRAHSHAGRRGRRPLQAYTERTALQGRLWPKPPSLWSSTKFTLSAACRLRTSGAFLF